MFACHKWQKYIPMYFYRQQVCAHFQFRRLNSTQLLHTHNKTIYKHPPFEIFLSKDLFVFSPCKYSIFFHFWHRIKMQCNFRNDRYQHYLANWPTKLRVKMKIEFNFHFHCDNIFRNRCRWWRKISWHWIRSKCRKSTITLAWTIWFQSWYKWHFNQNAFSKRVEMGK